ncbi:MAG: GldG family protein [Victivallaceae bacterium]|nr:GldG family protein [Victivallaceae bacterium]
MSKPQASKNISATPVMRPYQALMLYFSILCFSVSWLFGLHVFVSPNYLFFSLLITAGVSLLLPFAFSSLSTNCFEQLPPWLIAPALLSAVMLPWPYRTGPLLLTAGLILLLPAIRKLRLHYLGRACLVSGMILMAQAAFFRFHDFLFTGNHDASWLAKPLAVILNFLGTDVAASNGIVFVKTISGIEPFRITWEALATLPFSFFICGATVFMIMFCEKKRLFRTLVKFFTLTALCFIFRYILIILAYIYVFTFILSESNISGIFIFWTPLFVAVSLIPVPLLLTVFFRQHWEQQHVVSSKYGFIRLLIPLLAVAVFTFVFCLGFNDPGYVKPGRILFDSAHSKWEPFDRPYDTTWYGHDSGYNYSAIYSFLKKTYDVTDSKGELTDDLLAQNDILILKIPTRSFSESEQQAVLKFVNNGGGLFLLGEHTNVFGSSVYINPIAKMFGMSFEYNCVFDIETKFEQMYRRPLIIPHPVIANLPDFLFEVSSSIKPESIFVEPIIRASGLKTIDIDYSSRNFYPQVNDNVDMRFGTFLQAAARRYGKGRVVAFADSTCYSNFSAFQQGKPEFLLGTLSWLNRKNSFVTPLGRTFAILACVAGLFLIFTVLVFNKPKTNFLVSITVWIGFAVVLALFTANRLNFLLNPVTTPRELPPMLAFEREHCDYDLPDEGFIKKYYRSFGIFHQWVLRVDYFPRTFATLDESIAKSKCLVLIRPFKKFSASEIKQIDDYVKNGGKLLVIDDSVNKKSSSNQLLGNFGISFDFKAPIAKGKIMTVMGRQILCDITNTMPVTGGTPLLYSVKGAPLATFNKHGKGMVVAVSLASLFSDTGMGFTQSNIPKDDLVMVYALEFALIKGLMANDIETRMKKITLPQINP